MPPQRHFTLIAPFALCLAALLPVACRQTNPPSPSPAASVQTFALLRNSVAASSQPTAIVNGVMMEGFYWNTPATTPSGSWWNNLAAKAPELAKAGITAIWIPPPYKGAAGTSDVGYGVYDRYDLGEFNYHGAIPTHYGTLAELQTAIAAFHAQNVQVYADIVMNHMMGADSQDTFQYNNQTLTTWTHFSFLGRGTTYSNYAWQYFNFNGIQNGDKTWTTWNPWDFQPYANGQACDPLMGCEIRYTDPNNCNELIKWGNWITQKLNLDGYRLDATTHIYTPFINQWLDAVKGNRFAVSEAWLGAVSDLQNYAQSTGGRTSLFDFPLHFLFASILNNNGDMRQLRFAGLTEVNGPLSVSFVENHDTDGPNTPSPVVTQKILAYAYILTRDKGYPCIFYRDYYEYGLGPQIAQLIALRQSHAFGPSKEYDQDDPEVYIYSRAGDATHTGLLEILDDNNPESVTIQTPWPNTPLKDATGNQPATITTDATGSATFPIAGHSYSIWIAAN